MARVTQAGNSQGGAPRQTLNSRSPSSSRVGSALLTPVPAPRWAVQGCSPDSVVRPQGQEQGEACQKGAEEGRRGVSRTLQIQGLSACRRPGPSGWASEKEGMGRTRKRCSRAAERGSARAGETKCMTGTMLLPVPEPSHSAE